LMKQYPMVVSVSPDGSKLLLKTRHADDFEIIVVDRQTNQKLFSNTSSDTQLSLIWSPNSQSLAFVSAHDGNRHFQLNVWDLGSVMPTVISEAETETDAQPLRW
jgi:Tol biopolymer transport system component